MKLKKIFSIIIIIFFLSCKNEKSTLFILKTDSGIEFENNLVYTDDFNPYTYRNFYNGAGVSIGDISNDGLLDVYITGNMVSNKLYLTGPSKTRTTLFGFNICLESNRLIQQPLKICHFDQSVKLNSRYPVPGKRKNLPFSLPILDRSSCLISCITSD